MIAAMDMFGVCGILYQYVFWVLWVKTQTWKKGHTQYGTFKRNIRENKNVVRFTIKVAPSPVIIRILVHLSGQLPFLSSVDHFQVCLSFTNYEIVSDLINRGVRHETVYAPGA